jgi:hypothetical protein
MRRKNDMKKFKCVLVRSQYQTVELEAENWNEAEAKAVDLFDADSLLEEEYVEVYDLEEVKQ